MITGIQCLIDTIEKNLKHDVSQSAIKNAVTGLTQLSVNGTELVCFIVSGIIEEFAGYRGCVDLVWICLCVWTIIVFLRT